MPTTHAWGIIGAGSIAHSFAADMSRLGNARLVGVASRTPASASALAAATPGARAHSSIADLLADPTVDIVYIASPPKHHEEQAISALRAGKHVVVEKPFTLDAPGAQRVIDAAEANQRFCMEAMWSRFLPAIVEAKRIVANGELGEIRLLSADFSLAVAAGADHHLIDPIGGGALGDRGMYGVSLARHLLGAPDRVDSHVHRNQRGIDEDATILLHHPGGALASITTSMQARGTNQMVVMGTGATLTIGAPFWGSQQLSIQPSATTTAGRPVSASDERSGRAMARAAGLAGRAKHLPLARRAKLLVGAVAGEARAKHYAYAGHGLHLEAADAQRCIDAGRIESDVMPHCESLAVMETLDAIRRRWDA